MNNSNKRLQSLSKALLAVGFSCDMQKGKRSFLRTVSQFFNLSFRIFISLIFVSHISYAGEQVVVPDVPVRPTQSQTTIVTPASQIVTPGPQNMYGTGQYYQNAGCPYAQTNINVTSRGQRMKDFALEIGKKLEIAKGITKNMEIQEGGEKYTPFGACKRKYVNPVIREVCGDPDDEWQGEHAIDEFETHMRSYLSASNKVNYFRTYQVVYEGILNSKMSSPDRAVADDSNREFEDTYIDELRQDTAVVSSASFVCKRYLLENSGGIDRRICFQSNKLSSEDKQMCSSCLRPSAEYPNGFYPTKYAEFFKIQQDIAQLQQEYDVALAKASCVDIYIDGVPPGAVPDANAFRRCMTDIKNANITSADYCLYCDAAGQIPAQESAFTWRKWGPGLLTALGVIGLGAYGFNQVQKTRDGNWEAGYPSDDRSPAVMATYALGGAGLVVNTLRASGAFGCAAQMASGQAGMVTAPVGLAGMVQTLFGGNINAQIGGAAGYPGNWLGGGNAGAVGGVFNNNPYAGPWGVQGNMQGNIAAQSAALEQARLNLLRSQQQNQQQLESLTALGNLQATLQGLEAQNLRTNQQIAEIQAQAAGISAGLNTNGYGNGAINGGIGGLAQTGAGLRLGVDFDLNAGLAGNGNAGMGGPMLGGGASWGGGTPPFVPGGQFPPYSNQRNNYVDRTNYDYGNSYYNNGYNNNGYNNGYNDPYYNSNGYTNPYYNNNGYNDPYYNNNSGLPNYSRTSGGSNYNYNNNGNDNLGLGVPSLGN